MVVEIMKVSRAPRYDRSGKTASKSTPIFRLSKNAKDKKVFLALKGFGQQDLVDSNDVAEALNQLPVEHLQGLDEITLFPGSANRAKAAYRTKKSGPLWGRFLTISHRIEIYRVDTVAQFYWSLFHELGHYVMDSRISSKNRKRWVTQLHRKAGAVSEYANRNAHEDFAESYACFVTDPARLLQCDRERFLYMNSIVFDSHKPDVQTDKKNKRTLDLTV